MKNVLLASTSTLYGGQYLGYLQNEIRDLFNNIKELLFIPYARPSGISCEAYTFKVKSFFNMLDIDVAGLENFDDPLAALQEAQAVFTGGGNTFLLVKTMYEFNLFPALKARIEQGMPYLGASAGSNIAGINMKTTNDMPIVYPPSFNCMGIVPFNINPHYLDPDPRIQHNGETRETRIKEFLTQNDTPVIGLREGSWLRLLHGDIKLEGFHSCRVFEKHNIPYELEPGVLPFK
ncbi:MAG: dipeptidase E [Niastella sp. SCN 39-18]|nr:dipeptidase PepE [Sphingobacteriales bacterium]ODT52085.1 MAG: dipeptidase E [Niastella sp. SCN 39-18]OJW11046.1 MAG: dipeptidase E [Sphingobacteriales bacterium 39-19]